jgi:GTP cyclohydrolase I
MPQETPREIELSEALARVTGEVAELRTENKLLREKIEALIRRIFGAQSEKLDREQLLMTAQKRRSPWKRRHHGARRQHRLRVSEGSRGCPSICPLSRK